MRRLSPLLATATVLLAGCGGDPVLERAEVERETREQLSETVGQQAPPVKCPGDLEGKVGATMRCTMDFADEQRRLGVTVRVDGVDGDRVSFDIEADEEFEPLP